MKIVDLADIAACESSPQHSFWEGLRTLDIDQVSERLNSIDTEVRVRPVADMRCLISLVDHTIKRTRFRKEVRVIRM